MKIEEILKQYDKEWLLIKVNKWSKDWEPLEGEVIFHSPSGEEVRKKLSKLGKKKFDFAILYAGKFELPADTGILL